MKHIQHILLGFMAIILVAVQGIARNPEDSGGRTPNENQSQRIQFREDCAQASEQIDQQINNVRARLLNGGDVWWDLNGNGRYIVPKVEPGSGEVEVSSIFAGSVWVGGFDDQENLRMAANTYRSASSNDWFPGPLTPEGITDPETCDNWDQFFVVTGEEIQEHLRKIAELGDAYSPADVPDGIRYWPGKGNPYFIDRYGFELPNLPQGLGSYKDFGPGFDEDNPDGTYNPVDGDYPVIEIRGCELEQFPDEMIFWIYNDNGGPHTETQATPIRMEVQVQAFAYATNDEINNMTFQRYKLINRAETSLDSTFFAMWVDGDLGCSGDDFIGCDTSLSLMYLYNEDEVDGDIGNTAECDGNAPTYGTEVPLLGVDYFRGPLGPKVFTEDGGLRNPRLGESIDTIVELGMSSFTYYNRRGGPGGWPPGMTDPENGEEYYRYLSGSWRDGSPYTFGGSGFQSNGPNISYAFTSRPDDPNGWSMCTANLALGDRRTIQASGPFRLDPGAFNELIIGVVWTPDIPTYPCPDITPLLRADVKAQALFDACFDILDGPWAPDLGVIELDRQAVFTFSNDTIVSNNKFLSYSERGLDIPKGSGDSAYVFEGYRLYQLAGPTVDPSAEGVLENPELARPVLECDIRNGVRSIYNWEPIDNPFDGSVPVYSPVLKVQGVDEGIVNSFVVNQDAFASSQQLINHKRYYYTVIAYAYNNYDTFDRIENVGQAVPYVVGRQNIKVYEVIPRPTPYGILNSTYGQGFQVTRLDGSGPGNTFLRLTDESRESILSDTFGGRLVYEEGSGPVEVKIYNPYEATDGDYLIEFFDDDVTDDIIDRQSAKFRVTRLGTDEQFTSEVSLDKEHEQLIPNWGLSIFARDREAPGNINSNTNGAIGSEITFQEDAEQWLQFWPENQVFNWMKTDGSAAEDFALDPMQAFSGNIINGPLYPFSLCDFREPTTGILVTPAWYDADMQRVRNDNPISNLNNVDIVLTPDRSKWSKCIVVETSNPQWRRAFSTQGATRNFDVRDAPSRGKEVDPATGEPVILAEEPRGFSYFPGYAIDVSTGKRLNIFFGENSVYSDELTDSDFPDSLKIGGDMIWNPTSDQFVNTSSLQPLSAFFGGHHMIYVTNQEYDGCESIRDDLFFSPGERLLLHKRNKRNTLPIVQWGGLPILSEGFELNTFEEGLIPSEVVISMRVDQPYRVEEATGQNNGYPMYKFSVRGTEPQPITSDRQIDSALDQVNVVPNPYYGFSQYENSSFARTVKITNLPPECTVTIYSLEGKFIRQYKRNEGRQSNLVGRTFVGIPSENFVPAIEWDLNNAKGIPIASGVYLIHIDAPGLGERVIKWVGVNRQFDPAGL